MINNEIEKKIVYSFIVDKKRERALFELNNKNKRKEFIWQVENKGYIDEKCIKTKLKSIESFKDVLSILKSYGAPEICYVLSLDLEIDGKFMPLALALEQSVFNGPVFISCVHGKLAYFGGEEDCSQTNRFILMV